MSETDNSNQPNDRLSDDVVPGSETSPNAPEIEPGLRERVHKFIASAQEKKPPTKEQLSRDRTRSVMLLTGGVVGASILFIGIFSSPPMPMAREGRALAGPNLGRLESAEPNSTVAPRSVTPLLNADVRSDDSNEKDLSPVDIRNTSQRSVQSADGEVRNTPESPRSDLGPVGNAARGPASTRQSTGASDPSGGYRTSENVAAPTYRYGGAPVDADGLSVFRRGADGALTSDHQGQSQEQRKSSIVFVRTTETTAAPVRLQANALDAVSTALLPPGTRLIARLEAAVTSALRVPVVASIEHNYERDGKIVLPAGTRVLGELQQASNEGHVSIRFHTLQTPGKDENIEAVAVDFNQQPLKGSVSGKNTGKKILGRTLSGVGTIAAYVVGAGGVGMNRSITGETLLRDRLASNIALAGEQELMNSAYTQNITVTLPANTRFYIILEKPAVQGSKSVAAPASPVRLDPVQIPTAQELRELMDLRREITRMYSESNRLLSQDNKPE